jgi:hypothetical protein
MDPASPFIFKPTRATQPYRQQPGMGRAPGPALDAMTRGRTLFGQNPQDLQRQLQAAQPGSLWWHILSLSSTNPTMGGR